MASDAGKKALWRSARGGPREGERRWKRYERGRGYSLIRSGHLEVHPSVKDLGGRFGFAVFCWYASRITSHSAIVQRRP